MLDDLRDADFVEEDEDDQVLAPEAGPETQFLGMTPAQRFMIALMIMMMICILGAFFLLITEKVWLPF